MILYESSFYGDISPKGYQISYLLLDRHIKHRFILIDSDFIFTIKTAKKIREFIGFEEIVKYIQNYNYVFDFPEVENWWIDKI